MKSVEEHVLNESALRDNSYPGRGIIMGIDSTGTYFVQVYWLMGRSENSRNRILSLENENLKTKAYDPSKVEDPSLIIYDAMTEVANNHIVSNGDQTTTIADFVEKGSSFEDALATRTYEPDAPNFTPRISGFFGSDQSIKFSIISKDPIEDRPVRKIYEKTLANFKKGKGLCIHTYKGDGDPIPSFDSRPFVVGIAGSAEDIAQKFWELLDAENKISIAVKMIPMNPAAKSEFYIINKNGETPQ